MAMAIEFSELAQGTPSVLATPTGTGYCSASDVASLNKPRAVAWNTAGNVTTTDVDGYIMMIQGQIDAVLVNKGYSVPVNTASFPEVAGLLAGVNAQGAAWLAEAASPQVNPDQVTRAKLAYDMAMAALEAAQFTLDIPVDNDRAQVRAPYVTYQPQQCTFDPQLHDTGWGYGGDGISPGLTNLPQYPFFSKSQRF